MMPYIIEPLFLSLVNISCNAGAAITPIPIAGRFVPVSVPNVSLIPSDNPTQSKGENKGIPLKNLVIAVLRILLLLT